MAGCPVRAERVPGSLGRPSRRARLPHAIIASLVVAGPDGTSRRRLHRALRSLALVVALVACGGGDRTEGAPVGPTPPDTTGTVQRGSLTVRVTLDAADAPVGTALGITSAAPAGFTVTLTALDDATLPPAVATTDAAGRVTFPRLLEGPYSVAVERALTAAERATLGPVDRDVSGFAGGAALTIRPGPQDVAVTAIADRPGSVVISEIWPHLPNFYSESVYLELYNNGDTTVFLDGMIFASLPTVSRNTTLDGQPSYDWCGAFAPLRADSTQLPVRVTQVFPGSGRDYPLAPGEAVVLAQDAIDHRPFAPGALDLSAADFESLGDARDVDNPAVPNVVGLPERPAIGLGRGFRFGQLLPDGYLLAAAPRAPLARVTVDSSVAAFTDIPLIPRRDILDVVMLWQSPEARALLEAVGFRYLDCTVPWHPSWDRAPARIVSGNDYTSRAAGFQRRVAYTRPDGRVVLQRTRTSARDWVYGPPASPGRVP